MNLTWILVSSFLVAVTFVGTYMFTGQTWDAMNAAGVVCLVYLVVFLYLFTRPIPSASRRRLALGLGGLVLAGTTIAWVTMYTTTNFQYDNLHIIRKIIVHGAMMEKLKTYGFTTLTAYQKQGGPKKASLGDIFLQETPQLPQDSVIDLDPDGKTKLLLSSVADSEVVLICQATIPIEGQSSTFRNFDGGMGMIQDRMRITTKGLVYEIQN